MIDNEEAWTRVGNRALAEIFEQRGSDLEDEFRRVGGKLRNNEEVTPDDLEGMHEVVEQAELAINMYAEILVDAPTELVGFWKQKMTCEQCGFEFKVYRNLEHIMGDGLYRCPSCLEMTVGPYFIKPPEEREDIPTNSPPSISDLYNVESPLDEDEDDEEESGD